MVSPSASIFPKDPNYEAKRAVLKDEVVRSLRPTIESCNNLKTSGLSDKIGSDTQRQQLRDIRYARCMSKRSSGLQLIIGIVIAAIGLVVTMIYAFDTTSMLEVTRTGLIVGLVLTLVGVVLAVFGWLSNKNMSKMLCDTDLASLYSKEETYTC